MKKLILILLLASCTKQETVFEPDPDLICVECFDMINHVQIEPFCGSGMECDKFIVEAEKEAREAGIMLHCLKIK